MARHLYKVGQRVHIVDKDADGNTIVIGWARVIKLMHLDDYYLVRFEDDNRIEARRIE